MPSLPFSLLVILLFVLLILISLIAILNTLTFPRLKTLNTIRSSVQKCTPKRVSILIPARNESAVIESTLRSLLAQTYPTYEIILLDDHSTDNTAALARATISASIRLSVLESADLPLGWKGKNWACHQLSQSASGDILIFTDADVRWTPTVLSAIVDEMTRTHADLLTIFPTQITESWTERLVVPLMGFAIMAYLPVLAVHYIPWPVFAAANGQCLAFRRSAYEQVGGHFANRDNIVEDMAFAYAIKRACLRLRMTDGNALIQTRMYHNWDEVRDGYAKNIIGGYANNIPFLLLSTFIHLAIFVFPWFCFAFTPDPLIPLSLVVLGILPRALTAAATRQRPLDAILMPISVLLMTIIATRAIYWHFTGGLRWKGRSYGKN